MAVLTGSGVSAASGIPTFRGAGGLWRRYRAEELATPQAYARDPDLVWEWYKMRFMTVTAAEPNEAHRRLAGLEAKTSDFILVTQNVDGLHERAGSRRVLELHGNLTQSRCEVCGRVAGLEADFTVPPHCSVCGARARPNVVWFGEALPQETLEEAVGAFAGAEVALVIGTSALVEPAASLGRLAAQRGVFVIEINPEATPLSPATHLSIRKEAVAGLATLLDERKESQ